MGGGEKKREREGEIEKERERGVERVCTKGEEVYARNQSRNGSKM